jgi:hypothetical protein
VIEDDILGYYEFALRLDRRQFELLEEMTEGPVLLQRLLSMNGDPITTLDEASAFLDKYWKRLAPYMFSRNSGQSPRAMEQLILKLANEDYDCFQLDFSSSCALTSAHAILLPIPELSAVEVDDRAALEKSRMGRKHSGAFTLVRNHNGYAIGIEFERITPPKPKTHINSAKNILDAFGNRPSKQPLPPRKRQSSPKRKSGMSAHSFLTSFNNRVTAHLKQQLAVSRQFTTTRFADLSGWGVSGGLPSLPKRR